MNRFPVHILETLKLLYEKSIDSFKKNSRVQRRQLTELQYCLDNEMLTPDQRNTIIRKIESSPTFDIPTEVEETNGQHQVPSASDAPIPSLP